MDNVILDVVLGLLLIYLVMALLVTKLQETVLGQFFSHRTRNLHTMLEEAVGNDKTLKDRILANSLIFALYKGDTKVTKPGVRAKGPSAIPPDLFTKALLIELYNDGKGNHPSVRFTPDSFLANLGGTKTERIWATLRGLLPGNEGNWANFEQAISDWFKAVGDRADGWYQRSAQFWSLIFAFIIALVFNADTFQLADRLANEPDLRRSLSTLAQNVNALAQQEQARERASSPREAVTPQPAVLPPDRRAEQALNQAAALLTAAYFRHEDVANFDPNVGKLTNGAKGKADTLVVQCANAQTATSELLESSRQPNKNVFLSNPINWVYLMPALQTQIKILRRPVIVNEAASTSDARAGIRPESIHDCIANLSGWVVLAAQRPGKDSASQDSLREAATQLSRAADAMLEMLQDQGAPVAFTRLFLMDPDAFLRCNEEPTITRDGLRQCVLAAQNGRINLPFGWTKANRRLSFCHVVAQRAQPTCGRSPSNPALCAPASVVAAVASVPSEGSNGQKIAQKASFAVAASTNESAARADLAKVDPAGREKAEKERAEKEKAEKREIQEVIQKSVRAAITQALNDQRAQQPAVDAWTDGAMDWLCGAEREFAGSQALRLQPIHVVGPNWFDLVAFVVGLLVTALFVALGAPFWFDLLGRVVKLRAAGSKSREDALSTPDGERRSGNGQGGNSGGGGAGTTGGSGQEPFSLARNDIELRLPAGDLIALQGALGVERTGVWDKATRERMAEESQRLGSSRSDELTNQLYLALLGRSPTGLAVLQPPTSSLKLRAEDPRCAGAATALMGILAFPNRIAPAPTTMTDELRALAVLWRYKKAGAAVAPHQRPVSLLARQKHALDDITAEELAEILKQAAQTPAVSYPREPALWLDWALGELGQAEASDPAAATVGLSNPRIVEYLEAAGKKGDGESTPWCASFLSWVLKRHHDYSQGVAGVAPAVSAVASFFSSFGQSIWTGGQVWPANVQSGDVVTLHLPQGHAGVNHVGFVLEIVADGVYAISGNYSGRVGIDHFDLASIVEVRRP